MKNPMKMFVLALFGAASASAQSEPTETFEQRRFHKVVFEITGGSLQPKGAMRSARYLISDGSIRPVFSSSGMFDLNFGYRVIKYLQLDSGIEFGGSVAGMNRQITVREVGGSRTETRTVKDQILMVPLGARAVVPLFSERLLIGIGGGGAYVRNYESAGANVDCTSCRSRSGMGSYALGRIEYVAGRNRNFGFALNARYTQAKLSAGFLPVFTRNGGRDTWLLLGGGISLRF